MKNGILTSVTFGLLMAQTTVALPGRLPSVRIHEGRLVGTPYPSHQPTKSNWEVLETEKCGAQSGSGASIPVSNPCEFLRGVYRYSFTEEGLGEADMLTEFTLTRSGNGHALLVTMPIAARVR